MEFDNDDIKLNDENQAAENATEQNQAQEPQGDTENGAEGTNNLNDTIMSKLNEMDSQNGDTDDNGEDGEDDYQAVEKPAEKPQQEQKQAQQNEAPKTPEEEEAELINTAKTERGKERLQRMFAERKEARQGLETVVTSFRDAGFDGDSINTVLAIGRLVSSGNKDDMRKGIAALDKIRANLCAELGEDVALADPLDQFPDLKQSVADLAMNRDQALELVRARERKQREQQLQLQTQQAQQFEAERLQAVKNAQIDVQQFFYSKSGEVDFGRKIKAIQSHFTPERLQSFTSAVPPSQWVAQLQVMWDSLSMQSRETNRARPISQHRNTNVGQRSLNPNMSLEDQLFEKMRTLGI